VLIVKDDSSLLLMKADQSGELDEVELPSRVSEQKLISAVLFDDVMDTFDTRRFYDNTPGTGNLGRILAVLGADGSLGLYSLPNLSIQIFYCEGVPFLTTTLAKDPPLPRHWKSPDTLVEIALADVGDSFDKATCLVIRTSSDDIVLYHPYAVPGSIGSFQFRKLATRRIAKAPAEAADESAEGDTRKRDHPIRRLPNICGLSAIFVPGASPALILKHAASNVRVHDLQDKTIKALNSFHNLTCPRGFIYIDDHDYLHRAQLPANADFGHSEWVSQKSELGEDVAHLAFFERTGSYVLATSRLADFQLPQDDEWNSDWQDEKSSFPPQVEEGSIKLFSPLSWRVISSYALEPAERAMCIKSMNLEISEETHEQKDLIVVGTAVVKGENVTSRGNIYIFDVVDVVPEPGVPETNLKLKLVAKEEVKGAVTALSSIGSQGFVLAAQGQKCMVRGLKEDLSILPVAFMDMRYYVKVAKELKGTGLCILGDAISGLWFTGYSVRLRIPLKLGSTLMLLELTGRAIQDAAVWSGSDEP
jgi:cleavage and polyadenylation specificity factor subunit 1